MIKKVCAVYDVKTACYDRPLLFVSLGEAIRSFADVANDKNTVIGQHPADFRLDYLSDFDMNNGEFCSPSDGKQTVIEAAQLVKE